MGEMKPFWVVWSPMSGPPTMQHLSKDAAVAEAKRLAGNCPGREFYVLESIGCAKKVDVTWIPVGRVEEVSLPF